MIKNRSVVSVVLLTIITCGIYGIYWVYATLHELEETTGIQPEFESLVVLLLTIFIPPIGYLFYGMSINEELNYYRQQHGMPEEDNKVLYMILGVLISIVLIGIVQNEINDLDQAQ